MRFRTLFLIAFFCVSAYAAFQWGTSAITHNLWTDQLANRQNAVRRTAIVLDRTEWVEFQLPPRATNIRLVTNAAVSETETPDMTQQNPRLGWRYSIEYQLLNSDRELLDQSPYHFRSRVQPLTNSETGETVYPMFFQNSDISAQTRVMQIGLRTLEDREPAILRIRQREADPAIKEIVIRALARVQRKNAETQSTWNRISKEGRVNICRYCVYNSELLSVDERANLLRWDWRSCTTLGEFKTRRLYSIGEAHEEAIDRLLLPVGKFVGKDWTVSIPIPEGKGKLKIQLTDLNNTTPENLNATVNWTGNSLFDRSHGIYEYQEPGINIDVEGGLVQVTTDQAVVLRAFWHPTTNTTMQTDSSSSPQWPEAVEQWIAENNLKPDGEVEITPRPIKVRTYLADDQQPLEYSITHLDDNSTPFRLSARLTFDNGYFSSNSQALDADSQQLTWEYLDADGNIVDTGDLTIQSELTHFDHLWVQSTPRLLSDQNAFILSVPNHVRRIRFLGPATPILISGSVRPAGLQRETQVPEGYFAFNRTLKKSRTWYGLRPLNHQTLNHTNRSLIVRTQVHTHEIDPNILSGNYDWQSYTPEGRWIGREILVPCGENYEARDDSLAAAYFEMTLNHRYDFKVPPVKHRPDCALIFAGADAPGLITIRVNGTPILQKKYSSSRGKVDLPLDAFQNDGSITITSDQPARVFMGGIDVNGAERHSKKTAQRFRSGKLEFDFTKPSQDKQLVTLKLYRGNTNDQRCRVRVKVEPQFALNRSGDPNTAWTVLDRVYDLRQTQDESSMLIDTQHRVDVGHRCFVPLDTDLPAGDYRITVTDLDGQNPYALLYQATPGIAPVRKVKIRRRTPDSSPVLLLPSDHLNTLDGLDERSEFETPQRKPQKTVPKPAPTEPKPIVDRKALDRQLREILKTTSGEAAVSQPSEEVLQTIQRLFGQTLRMTEFDTDIADRWEQNGWQLQELPDSGVFVLTERRNQRTGRGTYAFRANSESKIVLQAPHRFYDRRTGIIARKLFAENDFKAVAWNSAHRKQVDVAHQDRHFFNAFMNAVSDYETSVIQLHGFESDSREDVESTDVIVSDATRYPGRFAKFVALNMKETFGREHVHLYPHEVKQLGGTQNSQAALLRTAGIHRFLHLEMGSQFRRRLAESASDRAKFVETFASTDVDF